MFLIGATALLIFLAIVLGTLLLTVDRFRRDGDPEPPLITWFFRGVCIFAAPIALITIIVHVGMFLTTFG